MKTPTGRLGSFTPAYKQTPDAPPAIPQPGGWGSFTLACSEILHPLPRNAFTIAVVTLPHVPA